MQISYNFNKKVQGIKCLDHLRQIDLITIIFFVKKKKTHYDNIFMLFVKHGGRPKMLAVIHPYL